MINHFRTLLGNTAGPVVPAGEAGAEYIPPFRPLTLPGYLVTLRQRLFGAAPDPFLLRYRLHQLLAVVHATPLEEYVRALDTRLTYLPPGDDLADPALYRPRVHPLGGTAADLLTVGGIAAAPDGTGRSSHAFRIAPAGAGTVRIQAQRPPFSNLVLAAAPGTALALPGAGYTVRLGTADPGAAWLVEVTNRPQRDLGQIVADCALVGEPVLRSLFGAFPVEPYRTFANLWTAQAETPLRLAALVTALVYRTEEVRTRG